jgi:plasmid maintenance system antidote protein VapI
MTKTKSFVEILREAIAKDGRTGYRLAIDSGVASAVISRFMTGKRELNLGTAERLCRAVGLELRTVKRPKARKDG